MKKSRIFHPLFQKARKSWYHFRIISTTKTVKQLWSTAYRIAIKCVS